MAMITSRIFLKESGNKWKRLLDIKTIINSQKSQNIWQNFTEVSVFKMMKSSDKKNPCMDSALEIEGVVWQFSLKCQTLMKVSMFVNHVQNITKEFKQFYSYVQGASWVCTYLNIS